MSISIFVQKLSGEAFELEVEADMTMKYIKEQLRRLKWEDELSRATGIVELTVKGR